MSSFDISHARSLSPPQAEDSIQSDFMDDVMEAGIDNDAQVPEFRVVPGASKRGKDLLVESNGYMYNFCRRLANSQGCCGYEWMRD